MRLIYPPYNRKQERISQLVYELTAKPDFGFEVEKIRKKFGIKWWLSESEFEEENDKPLSRFWEDMNSNNHFLQAIKSLRDKFNLHSGWDDFLNDFILQNDSSRDPEAILFLKNKADDSENQVYTLQFYESTTLDEIKEVWKKIKPKIKKGRRIKIWKTFKRDKDVYDLASQGMTVAKINDFIDWKYGVDLDYGNIKRIISDYQKRMSIPAEYRVKKLRLR